MFEYASRRTDPLQVVFCCGIVPFGLAWALHQSVVTGFLLESYVITYGAFVFLPFDDQGARAKERWFWRAMFRIGVVIHPPVLLGLWLLDSAYPRFVGGTGTLFLMAVLIAAFESLVLDKNVDRFRPAGQP